MPIHQSRELETAYKKANRPVKLDIVSGGKHGGNEFYANERLDRIADEVLSTVSTSTKTMQILP